MQKRAISVVLTLTLLTVLFPAVFAVDEVVTTSRDPPEAAADEVLDMTVAGAVLFPDPDTPAPSDELFAAYVRQEFDRAICGGIAAFGTAAGDRLSGLEKDIYTDLNAKIAEVANGTRSAAAFAVSADLSSLKWTKSELGVSNIASGGSITEEARTAIAAKFAEAVSFERILDCLLADCPYELYWFDRTAGVQISWTISANSTQAGISSLTVSFSVSSDYASGTYTVNTSKTGAASTAVANAKAIVSANASKTDREKLEAYRAKICELVSYNSSAGGGAYGDPWQLIYVFDGDSATNVVCEGYAKAFQYLCDLSEFTGDVTCYTVDGTMTGGTGWGSHMWNVVKLEGKNLLADVTNCDSGTIGADTKLFLVAVSGTDGGRTHTFTIGSTNVVYTYDESQKDLFCSGYLALTPDSPSETGTIQLKVTGYDTACSTVVRLKQNGAVKKTLPKLGGQTGQLATEVITVPGVAPGVYDLVVIKSGCLDYTIQNVVVTPAGVDLTSHSNPAISSIVLPAGDVNGDGKINNTDLKLFRNNFGMTSADITNPYTDITGDGKINNSDLKVFRQNFSQNAETNCTFTF